MTKFLFLDVPTLKFRIISIILQIDQPEIILSTVSTTKNYVVLAWVKIVSGLLFDTNQNSVANGK